MCYIIAGRLLSKPAGALWVGFANPENDLLRRAEYAVESTSVGSREYRQPYMDMQAVDPSEDKGRHNLILKCFLPFFFSSG